MRWVSSYWAVNTVVTIGGELLSTSTSGSNESMAGSSLWVWVESTWAFSACIAVRWWSKIVVILGTCGINTLSVTGVSNLISWAFNTLVLVLWVINLSACADWSNSYAFSLHGIWLPAWLACNTSVAGGGISDDGVWFRASSWEALSSVSR